MFTHSCTQYTRFRRMVTILPFNFYIVFSQFDYAYVAEEDFFPGCGITQLSSAPGYPPSTSGV